MPSPQLSPIRQAWYKWKALRLPWRKRFLIGLDLQGNTYWEFRDLRGDGPITRWRRIVKFPSGTHYGDVKVSPQWSQWLRHARQDAPSLEEQHLDLVRKERLKILAAEADARWAAKPRILDTPAAYSAQRHLPSEKHVTSDPAAAPEEEDVKDSTRSQQHSAPQPPAAADPWAKAKAEGPSENWQPQAWTPRSNRKT